MGADAGTPSSRGEEEEEAGLEVEDEDDDVAAAAAADEAAIEAAATTARFSGRSSLRTTFLDLDRLLTVKDVMAPELTEKVVPDWGREMKCIHTRWLNESLLMRNGNKEEKLFPSE